MVEAIANVAVGYSIAVVTQIAVFPLRCRSRTTLRSAPCSR